MGPGPVRGCRSEPGAPNLRVSVSRPPTPTPGHTQQICELGPVGIAPAWRRGPTGTLCSVPHPPTLSAPPHGPPAPASVPVEWVRPAGPRVPPNSVGTPWCPGRLERSLVEPCLHPSLTPGR